MRYATRYRSTSYSSGNFPPAVKWLLIANTAMFLVQTFAAGTGLQQDLTLLALVPNTVVHNFTIWQLFTYLFLHGDAWHLLANMFTLWMFGRTLEPEWGTRQFLKYYFLCGIGAGLCDVTVNALLHNWNSATIGASGAIYGVLLAFGVMHPNDIVLFNFLFPIKAKYFVMIYGALALLGARHINTGVSNVAHLGGMLFGLAYLKTRFWRVSLPGWGQLRTQYNQWKLQRAKKKFQVYMRKHGSGRGPWVN
jgi:membrane associated rhomboid family serine protease